MTTRWGNVTRASTPRSIGTARLWHGTTASVALVAVAVQFVIALQPNSSANSTWSPSDVATRLTQFFSYFTIQSNLIVAAATVALAANPNCDSRVFRVVRMAGLYAITVTFVIYGALLAPGLSSGATGITNICLHYVVPFLTVVGWLVFGPRRRLDVRSLAMSAIWPLAFVIYTLIHGHLSGWYPYPFVNVNRLGLAAVVRNGAGIVCLMLALGGAYVVADKWLPPTSIGRLR
jgi:hypothetical protein